MVLEVRLESGMQTRGRDENKQQGILLQWEGRLQGLTRCQAPRQECQQIVVGVQCKVFVFVRREEVG